MSIAFYTQCVSPHQVPWCRAFADLIGDDAFAYVCDHIILPERAKLGWTVETAGLNVIDQSKTPDRALELIRTEKVLISSIRDLVLFEARQKSGLATLYMGERWLKPISIGVGVRCRCSLPGWLRLLVPSYRKMAKRFVKWANEDPGARVLAIGSHAKRDFLKLGVRADKLVPWGYFVAPSVSRVEHVERVEKTLRVLWAGRDIPLKHVRDIEKAVAIVNKNLASAVPLPVKSPTSPISFRKLTGVPMSEVRAAMRSHDTFVFASNGFEGWGAVVSEALEEGMDVIGTWECGAAPTLLPKERLYHCGDIKALVRLLEKEYRGELPRCSIGEWSAEAAATRLLKVVKEVAHDTGR